MELVEFVNAFGPDALMAGAIIYTVRMMLRWASKQFAAERLSHSQEIESILEADRQRMRSIIKGFSTIKDITADLEARLDTLEGNSEVLGDAFDE